MSLAAELEAGERFAFGANWSGFLRVLTDDRIASATAALARMLKVETLAGRSFLDIGSGSGLMSLAARRLGARVHSFDRDPGCVGCTAELRRRYFPEDPDWLAEEGSVLDRRYVEALGRFDFVYSWGVLHHTGALRQALQHAILPVAVDGTLFISVYNTQAFWTPVHARLKHTYVRSPRSVQYVLAAGYVASQAGRGLLKDLVTGRNPVARYRDRARTRGMSMWHDWIDWLGGYPFETATPEEIFRFCRDHGFTLTELATCGGGHGCNEFVFVRNGRG